VNGSKWSELNSGARVMLFLLRHVILVIVDKILMEGTSMNFGSVLSKMMMRRLIDVYKLPNPISVALMIKLL